MHEKSAVIGSSAIRDQPGGADLKQERASKIQLKIRPSDRRSSAVLYEFAVIGESEIHSILSTDEGRTFSEIAEMTGISRTETYHLLESLQEKKLVRATSTNPIRFVAVRD